MTNDPDEKRLAELKHRTRLAINSLQQHPDTIYAGGNWRGMEVWAGLDPDSEGSATIENIEWLFGLTLTHASVKHDEHGTALDLEYDLIEDHEIPVENDRITEILDFYDPTQGIKKPAGADIDEEEEFQKRLVSREDLEKGDDHNHDDVLAAINDDSHKVLHGAASDLLSDDNPFEIEHYLNLIGLAIEPNRFAILHALYITDEGKSASELEEVLGKDGHVHEHLDKLVDAGLVANWEKHDPEQHDTYPYYEISGTGHSIHEAITHLIDVEREASEQFRSGE